MMARMQYVTAHDGHPADISFPAVKVVMDLLEIVNQRDCLMKVQRLFHFFENERHNEI